MSVEILYVADFLPPIQQLNQTSFHLGPFRRDDRIAHRITRDEISGHAMRTEYAFKLASDALDRGTGTLIARVRVKADAKDLPDLEGVPQHEELGFGIRTGTNRGLREPRITDLAGIGESAPV